MKLVLIFKVSTIFLIFIAFAQSDVDDVDSNPCYGVWFGTVPHPEICYKYYTCTVQIPVEKSCGMNEIFDPELLVCIYGDQETCQPLGPTTKPPVDTTTSHDFTTRTSSTTKPHEISTTTKSGVETTTKRIKTTTTKKPKTTTTRKPKTTTTKRPKSTTTRRSSTATTSPITTTDPGVDLREICRNVFFGARPHPNIDYLYVGCIRGTGMVYQCYEQEVFDPFINECVRHCEITENICVGDSKVRVIANPCECAGYVICYRQQIVSIDECNAESIFDEKSGECRPGDQTTCQFH